MRIERLGDVGTAADVLRSLAAATARRGLPPPAAFVGDWFGSLFGGEKPVASTTTGAATPRPAAIGSTASSTAPRLSVGAAPVSISPMSAGNPPVTSARPLSMPAQPLAPRGNTSVSLSAPITVNAPPGMDAREIAALIESRLRALMRETTRSPAAAMYD